MRYSVTFLALLFFTTTAFAGEFKLTSPQIKEGATLSNRQVFAGFGCKGENISPALNWTNAPKGTKCRYPLRSRCTNR